MIGPDASTAVLQAAQRRLCSPDLTHDETLIALAISLGAADPHALRDRLDDAARALFGTAEAPLDRQAAAIVACLSDGLGLQAATAAGTPMLLHEALRHGTAHPMLMALLGHELARRGGLHSVVAWSVSGYWTLLIDRGAFLPIGCAGDDPSSGYELQPCCAHQVAHEMLTVLATDRRGRVAQRAAALAQALAHACADARGRGRRAG